MQQTANLPQDSITSGVNESRFIAHIQELFSSSTVALGEIVQNARRAQATKVMFDWNHDGDLIVTDDGIGISDFRTLVIIAESGWSDELMADEKPFGIGFASVCFSAERVTVESRGKQVTFNAADLVAKRPIPVLPASFIGGTRLVLSGLKIERMKAMTALRNIAKGFDIPILVEGEEMPRPHARSNLLGVQTSVGLVMVPGIHNDDLNAFDLRGHVYCQGLPVQAGDFTRARYYCDDQHPVVHIDHHKYLPRVPDRDCLIDAEVVSRDIENVLVGIMREHLRETKAVMPPEAFVTQYWNIAAKLGALDLMCDVPVLPTAKLSVITEDLRRPTDYESSWTAPTEVVTRAQVESGAVVLFDADLCDEEDSLEEGDEWGFAKMAFVARKGWVRVDSLPASHWAIPHVRDIEAMECHVTGTIVATGIFDGSWVFSKVTIVENLTVHLAGESVPLDQAISGRLDDQEEGGILVPRQATDPASALLQISTYRDENDTYMESDHLRDINEFGDVVALLNGEDPAETLRKCLRNGASGQRTNLRGKTFTVSFDADGDCKVS